MKTRILIDDNSTDGAYNVDGEVTQLDEYIKIQIDKLRLYIPKAAILAAGGYTEEHG